MSRSRLDAELNEIRNDVVRMGTVAHDMVALAVESCLSDSSAMKDEVLKMEEGLDRDEKACTARIIEFAALHGPVAQDLLFLVSSLVILGEIERTGDDAWKLARRSSKLPFAFPSDLVELLKEMDGQARSQLRAAVSLITQYDPAAVRTLIKADKGVDLTWKASRTAILTKMQEDPADNRQHLRISEIFHALEHVGDHAANIAKALRLVYERPQT